MKNENTKVLKSVKILVLIITILFLSYLAIKLFPLFSNLGTIERTIAI